MEIDHEIISTVILLLISIKPKYVHKVLVNCLAKFAQEKVLLGELTISTWT